MSGKPRITITLGRRGQVVKRAGPISEIAHSNYEAWSGGKRPVRERLGSHSDSNNNQSKNKRQRRENHKWRPSDDVANSDNKYMPNYQVGHDDLRLKLMHKSTKMNADADVRCEVDLREKLSRTAQMPLRFDSRQLMPESKESRNLRQIPPTGSADDLLQMDSLRKSYSAWTLDRLRCRSPDKCFGASRGYSPQRNFNDLRQVPTVRSIEDTRPSPFMTRSVIDSPRLTPFVTKVNFPVEAPKPGVLFPPRGGIMPRSSYLVEEPATVGSLLNSLGLGKYAILFQAEEVDFAALKQMGDNDLKELGIPMGPRKKILLAVLPRSRRPISHT